MDAADFKPTRDGRPDVGPPVYVEYKNYRGEVARRKVSPVGVWYGVTDWHKSPGWLVHLYDWDKCAWRDYALIDCNFAI